MPAGGGIEDESVPETNESSGQVNPHAIIELLESWHEVLAAAYMAHFITANRLVILERVLGLCVVVLSSASGTAAFATLSGGSFALQFGLGLWARRARFLPLSQRLPIFVAMRNGIGYRRVAMAQCVAT
jgi:hypothetical protein